MRYLMTGVTAVLLLTGVSAAQAGDAEVGVGTPTTEFGTSDISTGRSAFAPPSGRVSTEKRAEAVEAVAGGCSPVPARDMFGDAYRACASRTINPTESDELVFSAGLSPAGFRVGAAEVFAGPSVLASFGMTGRTLRNDRFDVPAATAAR